MSLSFIMKYTNQAEGQKRYVFFFFFNMRLRSNILNIIIYALTVLCIKKNHMA